MKTIIWDPQAPSIADDKAYNYAEQLIEHQDEIKVCNSLVVDWIRVFVKEGKLKHTDVIFIYYGDKITVGANGKLSHYPYGFCDAHMNVLMRLI